MLCQALQSLLREGGCLDRASLVVHAGAAQSTPASRVQGRLCNNEVRQLPCLAHLRTASNTETILHKTGWCWTLELRRALLRPGCRDVCATMKCASSPAWLICMQTLAISQVLVVQIGWTDSWWPAQRRGSCILDSLFSDSIRIGIPPRPECTLSSVMEVAAVLPGACKGAATAAMHPSLH